MTLALLFPSFAPTLYDLAAMLQADRIVLQDEEQWSRKSRTHRAKIRTPEGTQWINIPVRTEDKKKPIREVRIDHERKWVESLLRSLQFNYRNSLYFDFYEPELRADFEAAEEYEYLLPFVLYIRSRLFRFMELELPAEEELASSLPSYTSDPDQLAKQLDADRLFQEEDSRHYQRQARMREEPDFEHPRYRQHFDGFEPGCSVLDVLFQFGPTSFKIFDQLR